jgi:hypothetical protein
MSGPAVAAIVAWVALGLPAPAQVWTIRHNHGHVQGLDVSADSLWLSAADLGAGTAWIWRVDRRTLRTVAERDITIGEQSHPGGFQVSGSSLWVPVAENRPHSTARILELDAMTLADRSSFAVADHIGAVSTDGSGVVLGANWDSRKIYRWTSSGELLGVTNFPTLLAIQDMKWIGGVLYAGGTGLGREQGRCQLAELDPTTLAVRRRSTLVSNVCYTREGMAVLDGRFFFLPEDGPRSRIYAPAAGSLFAP